MKPLGRVSIYIVRRLTGVHTNITVLEFAGRFLGSAGVVCNNGDFAVVADAVLGGGDGCVSVVAIPDQPP